MTAKTSIPSFALLGETEMFPDVVHCERIAERAPRHGWTIPPHRHAQMAQLFLIEEGSVLSQIDGQEHRVAGSDFIFIPMQTVHGFVFAPQTTGLVLSFPSAVVTSIGPVASDLTQKLAQAFKGQISPRLWALAGLLSDTLGSHGIFRAQAAVGLAHAVLSSLAEIDPAEQDRGGARPDPRLAQLDALITAQIGKGWRASDFADAMAISTGHLSRLCRTAKGVGTTAYIEAVIMQEASRLLAFTQIPAADVGFRLGFNDPSYFSRRFRMAHGLSPSDYRKRFAT